MGRKRQRSRATLTDDDDDDDDDELALVDESESGQDRSSRSQADETGDEVLSEERKREQDVWDAFKEEHHEVLEQLPLSLHRQFKLMRELDGHSEVFVADLLESVRRYIRLRESLAAHANGTDGDDAPMEIDVPRPGETTRKLLQHIAQTSEEAIRTAEEKVSIAQTAYETVDRHIRLLDQAIKEQEAAISLGVRPGTHLAPILLPDLVVPRWARPPRVEHSPVPSLSPEPELYAEELPVLELPAPKVPKKSKKAAPRPPRPEKEEVPPPAVVGGEEAGPPPPGPSVPADPNEARYCYCNQVSFGTMIGCDNEDGCRLEWFHLGCTGLQEVPSKKTKWYCRECKPKMTQRGKSRT